MTPTQIIKAYKIPVNRKVSPKYKLNYDGKWINAKGLDKSNLLHEICHWIMASPKQRRMPDYGLGEGPSETNDLFFEAMEKLGQKPMTGKFGYTQEIKTCTLQFIFTALCGLDCKEEMENLKFTTYGYRAGAWESRRIQKEFNQDIEKFKRQRLINEDWMPAKLKSFATEKDRVRLKNFRTLIDKLNWND